MMNTLSTLTNLILFTCLVSLMFPVALQEFIIEMKTLRKLEDKHEKVTLDNDS